MRLEAQFWKRKEGDESETATDPSNRKREDSEVMRVPWDMTNGMYEYLDGNETMTM